MEDIVKKIKLEPSIPLQSDDIDKDKPINKNDFGVVFNFLAKIACQVCFYLLINRNYFYKIINISKL